MTPLYSIAAIRAIERAAFAAAPSFSIMQQAGQAVATAAQKMQAGAPILAIAGAGNNGGDAYIAAAALRQSGYAVQILQAGDAAALPPDAARARALWHDAGGKTTAIAASDNGRISLPPAALIIDGLFGIGLSRAPQGKWRDIIAAINAHPAAVLAIDIPSGLCADSGCALGAAVRADATVTFFGGKPGLYTGDGPDHCGNIQIVSLAQGAQGTQSAIASQPPSGHLMQTAPSTALLRRRKNTHKGTYGTLALLGGANGMLGALLLAARAAATLGAGKTIACPIGAAPLADFQHPEIIWHSAARPPAAATCIAAGMGLGLSRRAAALVRRLLASNTPLLLDADALTLMANHPPLQQRRRPAPLILTPHPGEAARLLAALDSDTAVTNRPAAAQQLANAWQATVVLKGAGSIIAAPNRPFIICGAGNPGLARGGSGDILAGIIAALLAQTQDVNFSAQTGTYLHAAAADHLATQHGEIALDINQIAPTAAHLLNTP